MLICQQTHFGEQIQLDGLAPGLEDTRQAVRAQANIDPRPQESAQRKHFVMKKVVTAGAMHHTHPALREQSRIPARKIIGVGSQQIGVKHPASLQMPDGRTQAAIGHFPSTVAQPIKHVPPRLGEHEKFRLRFGNVRAKQPAFSSCDVGGAPQ